LTRLWGRPPGLPKRAERAFNASASREAKPGDRAPVRSSEVLGASSHESQPDGQEIAAALAHLMHPDPVCQDEPAATNIPATPNPPRLPRLRELFRALFSFHAVLIVGLVVITVFTIANRFNDPDLWFHLKLGQVIWTTHSIPTTDTFSFTAYGHPWIAHEWLAQLGIYAVYRLGGYPGLMLGFAVLASLLFVLVYVLCFRYSASSLVAFLGAVCAWFFATIGLAIRPLLLGHLFLVVELILLEFGSRNRRWLWALPPLFAVWVNVHGSYFFGMGVLFVYWACSFVMGEWGLVTAESWDKRSRKTLGAVLVLSGVALCCNPVGTRLLTYPLNMLFQQPTNLASVEEWLPPDLRTGRGYGLILAAIGLLLVPLLRRSDLRLRELLLAAVAFALAMQHTRMLFIFGIVVSPFLCRICAPVLGSDVKREHPVANGFLIAALVCSIVLAYPAAAALQQQIRKANPTLAVDYIKRTGLSGPMLNEYVFGGYLLWALPEQKVFIDGRGDVYEWAGVFREYGQWATLSENPKLLLDKYGIRFCLLARGSPLAQVIPYLPGWRTAYSDKFAIVFAR
jgi:hypothetical protein